MHRFLRTAEILLNAFEQACFENTDSLETSKTESVCTRSHSLGLDFRFLPLHFCVQRPCCQSY